MYYLFDSDADLEDVKKTSTDELIYKYFIYFKYLILNKKFKNILILLRKKKKIKLENQIDWGFGSIFLVGSIDLVRVFILIRQATKKQWS